MTYPMPPTPIPPDPSQELRRVRRLAKLLTLLTFMLIVVLGLYLFPLIRDHFFSTRGARVVTERGPLYSFEQVSINVFKDASPSVAFITVNARVMNRRTRNIENVTEGEGSGFIWDEQGDVVTNYHVVQNASAAHVVLSDQTSYDAELIGVDPDHDIAVLRISVPLTMRLTPLPLGRMSDLQVGQSVFAIGNPFGLDQSMTTGVISALKRTITGVAGNPIEDMIQTDAAINPGNSGGPLLDSAGRLIGVNTAILSQEGNLPPGYPTRATSWTGIGFAIPVDTLNRVVPQILAKGKYEPVRIGVQLDDSLRQLMPANLQGLPISGLDPGSPAEKAALVPATLPPAPPLGAGRGRGRVGGGLQGQRPVLGDVITHVNDKPMKSTADLFSALDRASHGDTLTLTVWNNGEVRRVPVKTQ